MAVKVDMKKDWPWLILPLAVLMTKGGGSGGQFPKVYPPGSQKQIDLFRRAARKIGVPESWASSHGLKMILTKESGGVVGRPNYTYGTHNRPDRNGLARASEPRYWREIWSELKNDRFTAGILRSDGTCCQKSSATGLGQLLQSNVKVFYPDGVAGIGDPLNEAAGMLAYIKKRYGDPDSAWAQYGMYHEGY